jgi:hypothetical protein
LTVSFFDTVFVVSIVRGAVRDLISSRRRMPFMLVLSDADEIERLSEDA